MIQVKLKRFKIQPGEYRVSGLDEEIATVLGSCVSVCLYDERMRVGGMNHYMLPEMPPGATNSPKYGREAITRLLNDVVRIGGIRSKIVAKITGGSTIGLEKCNVSQNNVKFADTMLASLGIPVVARDVGGHNPRKVVFYPTTGKLLVKKLPPLAAARAWEDDE